MAVFVLLKTSFAVSCHLNYSAILIEIHLLMRSAIMFSQIVNYFREYHYKFYKDS